ncbi:MAG: HAD family hydrolase [Neisseriaceae bacterium]|nr:HAD family hydrolase [Neisseriaceae bacterium]MBP6863204.1 HAD family hydrolase [Neisseriaceae bacterium]
MQNVNERAQKIKLLIMDVDGVMTDGQIYLTPKGDESKAFHTLDGLGLKMLQASGVKTAIMTGRDAQCVAIRAKSLGINHYMAGVEDKREAFAQLLEHAGVRADECAYIGDDVVDLPPMVRCGLAVAVPEAHELVLKHSQYVTKRGAGRGAVRELCELIMQAQGTLDDALSGYLL